MQLTDRVALITGGKRIGTTVAEYLAGRGADIALTYRRSEQEANRAAELVRAKGRKAVVLKVDLSRSDECARAVTEAQQALGRLDVLVNMASVYLKRPFEELTERDWDLALAVDLRAAALCAQAAVPHMRVNGGGRIVNFADWVARSGRPAYSGYLAYYVAKMGVIGLTEALALELAGDGILVNAIAPGPIRPPGDLDDEQREAVARATPLGRWGGDGEIAKAVGALVDSDFITGETIRVDGGRHVR